MFPPNEPTPTFPYRIVQKVGEGAMGIVYRAEDLELGRHVAIKVIKPAHLASLAGHEAHAAVRRFIQEARAAAALAHPGATVVHRVGTEAGWPFIAMEWIDGQTLEEHVAQRKRLPLDQVARIGLQVLAVLSAAHQLGIVHRDIKPANLMVTKDGRLKVTDFGIARVQGSSLAQTQAGAILGTPKYSAPEQLAGRAVDLRVDLYALGGVLYEAASGRPPFEATNLYELLSDVQLRPPTPPGGHVPGLPPAFDAFVLRALAKNPEDRFASAREMALALQPFLAKPAAAAATATGGLEATFASRKTPVVLVDAQTPHGLVAAAVRTWPASPLGRQDAASLLSRLVERPLHAAAFCGAVEVPGGCLLICDGILYGAFDPATGRVGDEVVEGLGREVDATLYALPAGVEPRLVALLASLLHPPEPRLSGLDSSFANLPQLAGKLESEGFDGAVRLTKGALLAFAFFSRGRRVLDLYGGGWPVVVRSPWADWIARSGVSASVEERRTVYPSLTFRQQLRDFELEVVRPTSNEAAGIRTDTLAQAQALELHPRDQAKSQLRRGDSTLQSLVTGDPAYLLARWVLVDLAPQLAQHGRSARWKALVDPLPSVKEVRLHHALAGAKAGSDTFDLATYGEDGRLHHVVDRVAAGTAEAVERFFARVLEVKEARAHPGELGAAILVAPRFSEEALEAYLKALRSTGSALLSSLGALTHTEGYVRLGARRGFHVLLVEDEGGRRRPLVPG